MQQQHGGPELSCTRQAAVKHKRWFWHLAKLGWRFYTPHILNEAEANSSQPRALLQNTSRDWHTSECITLWALHMHLPSLASAPRGEKPYTQLCSLKKMPFLWEEKGKRGARWSSAWAITLFHTLIHTHNVEALENPRLLFFKLEFAILCEVSFDLLSRKAHPSNQSNLVRLTNGLAQRWFKELNGLNADELWGHSQQCCHSLSHVLTFLKTNNKKTH